MGADYIEYQDKHGKPIALSLNIEAVEKLTEAAGRYGVPPFSTFIDGGRGVAGLLERFDIPRKELAAELQVSKATVTNWTRCGALEPVNAERVLDAVSKILGRRGAADHDADIAAYVAPRMAPIVSIDVPRAKRGFVSETLTQLTESQVDILLEVMRGLLLCNGDTETADNLARAVAAVEAVKG